MRKLIIAPHPDDEILGCSSILDEDTIVYYLGINEFHIIPSGGRVKEIEAVSKHFGFAYKINWVFDVDRYEMKRVLDEVQEMINEYKPSEIYIPHPSYNQDHKTTYDGCFTALRIHDKNFFVKKAFVYEQVHNWLWDDRGFTPNYFKKLIIQKKLMGYALHASQVRKHRSKDKIVALARLRGMQSDMDYAEGFRILRWVD